MEDFSISGWLGHGLSGFAIVGTIIGWFPPIAAFVAFTWYMVQLYESDTVQNWLATRRLRKIAAFKKSIARLSAQEKIAKQKRRKSGP